MYTHPTSFHDQNTQIKFKTFQVTKFIHPKTWITLIARIPRCPVLLLGLHQIPGVFCFLSFCQGDDLIDGQKCEGPSLRKKIQPKNDRNTSFQLLYQKAHNLTDLFFKLPPIETHHIPSHQPHPIDGVMPSCVFCHASGMTIMITSARSRVPGRF